MISSGRVPAFNRAKRLFASSSWAAVTRASRRDCRNCARVIAMLPGSRRSELHYMADLFVLTARRLLQDLPDAHFIVPTASRATREMFEASLRRHETRDLPLTLLFGHSHEALAAADLALVASGTATLETALFKTPMVIVYKQSPVTWALMKRMLYLPYIGLPNILAGDFVVPEFLQEQATVSNIAQALGNLYSDSRVRSGIERVFSGLREQLTCTDNQSAAESVLAVAQLGRAS